MAAEAGVLLRVVHVASVGYSFKWTKHPDRILVVIVQE